MEHPENSEEYKGLTVNKGIEQQIFCFDSQQQSSTILVASGVVQLQLQAHAEVFFFLFPKNK